jgi:DNA processing protein
LRPGATGFSANAEAKATGGPAQQILPLGPSAEIGRKLLALLKIDANTQIDELLGQMEDCSPSEVIAALFELEMLGLVRQLPGRNFVKVW